MDYELALEEFMAVQYLGIGLDYYHTLPGSAYWATEEKGFMTKSHILAAYRTLTMIDAIKKDMEYHGGK